MRESCAKYTSRGTTTTIPRPNLPKVTSRLSPVTRSRLLVNLGALLHELDRLLLHAALDVVAHILRDLHRAEVRPAHRAEMRHLHRVLRQRLVVEVLRGIGIEPEVELVCPAEFEPPLGESVVPDLRARVP